MATRHDDKDRRGDRRDRRRDQEERERQRGRSRERKGEKKRSRSRKRRSRTVRERCWLWQNQHLAQRLWPQTRRRKKRKKSPRWTTKQKNQKKSLTTQTFRPHLRRVSARLRTSVAAHRRLRLSHSRVAVKGRLSRQHHQSLSLRTMPPRRPMPTTLTRPRLIPPTII